MRTPKFWQKRGAIAYLLWPLSCLYQFISHLDKKNKLKQVKSFPIPLIVVGNITVGGSGKTPVTLAIIKELQNLNIKVGFISRGYGRSSQDTIIANQVSTAKELGDEPFLIYEKTRVPTAIGRSRYEAGTMLLQNHPNLDVLISDDGLQHYQLQSQIKIAVVGYQGFGNRFLLPAGPLRETLHRLQEMDFIISNCSQEHFTNPNVIIRMDSQLGLAYSLTEPTKERPLTYFTKKKISALAGIAYPENFFRMLREAGLELCTFSFPDHHCYTLDDFENIPYPILMTEKDAIKCQTLPIGGDIWVVPLVNQLPNAFFHQLVKEIKPLAKEDL